MRTLAGLVAALGLVVGAGAAGAQLRARPIVTLHGFAAGDAFGLGLAAAGDLNADGCADFVIGAANADGVFADVGRAYAFLGGAHLDSLPDAIVLGRTPSGLAGSSLAAIGDVNGDGYDDWLVASPNYDTGATPRFTGKVWLHLGAAALNGSNDKTFDTPRPGSLAFYGTGLAGIGDFDGDGAPDFAIGGLVAGGDSISAYVYRGGTVFDAFPDLPLHMPPGWSTRAITAGDVNGDGWNDVVVGTSGNPSGGRIFVYYGGPGADGEPDVVLASGTTYIDLFGWTVACGDVNGDGFADILTGAGGRTTSRGPAAGVAMLWLGGPAMHAAPDFTIEGSAANDELGFAVAIPGDLDGDGYADLVVSAPYADGPAGYDAGKVDVCFGGPDVDLVPDLVLDGEVAGDLFGADVAGAGDPDGGGSPTLLVGATHHRGPGTNAGCAYLFRVARFGILEPRAGAHWLAGGTATVRWTGADPADVDLSLDAGATWSRLATGAGGAAENAVTVTVPDAVTARACVRLTASGQAPLAGASTRSAGLFHVTRAAPAWPAVLAEPVELPAAAPGRLGSACAAGFDWNGDGVPDLVAGAPAADDGAIVIWDGAAPESVLAVIAGRTPLEKFGASLAVVPIAGDPFDGLAVGSPGAGAGRGRVDVFRGGRSANVPAFVLDGRLAGELFGTSVAAAADVDGDHLADLVVGSPGSSGAGHAYVYRGGALAGPPAWTLAAGVDGAFGQAVAGAGDVNGDGLGDLLVSGPSLPGGNGAGTVHLLFGGAPGARLSRVILEGESIGDGFGTALAAAGDLDGDGFADFAVGAPLSDRVAPDAGAVFVYHGSPRFAAVPGLVLTGREAGDFFGSALAGGGDLDFDGTPDLVIGSPGANVGSPGQGEGAGAVDVLYGGSDSTLDLFTRGDPGSRDGESVTLFASPGRERAPVILAGAPFAIREGGEGVVRRMETAPWRLVQSVAGTDWLVGSRQTLGWIGRLHADVDFVAPGVASIPLARSAGGKNGNQITVVVPATLPDSGRLVLSAPGVLATATSGTIHVRRGITLRSFDWRPEGDGVRLAWTTDPPLAPSGVTAYRVTRVSPDGTRTVVADDLAATEFFDARGRAGDRYELFAKSEQGDELVAGTITLPSPPAGLRVWPQPAGENGRVQLAFAAPRVGDGLAGDLDVSIFDARGRRVAVLVHGRPQVEAGVVRLEWNGRDGEGHAAGPGLYFLRVRAPSARFETTRRVVMLDSPKH